MGEFKWTIRLTGIGMIVFLTAILLGGGGHGYIEPLMIGFPWMTICTLWAKSIPAVFWVLGLLQFPAYGLMIDIARATDKRSYINKWVWLSHLIMVVVILLMREDKWK
jgi:hypothetical protein